MSSLSKRWLCVFGAFAMTAIFVLSGCTDAMVGPEADMKNERYAETADRATLYPVKPLDEVDSHGVRGRLVIRFMQSPLENNFPPPDSSEADDDSTETAPMGRLRHPYAMPPPLIMPPDSNEVSQDTTATGDGESN